MGANALPTGSRTASLGRFEDRRSRTWRSCLLSRPRLSGMHRTTEVVCGSSWHIDQNRMFACACALNSRLCISESRSLIPIHNHVVIVGAPEESLPMAVDMSIVLAWKKGRESD